MTSKILLFVHAALATLALQSASADTDTRWSGSSEIAFSGTSTLHNWSGSVSATPFTATVSMNGSGELSHLAAKVEVRAAKMDTAEPKRDENMRKSMRVTEFPLISATMDAPSNQIMTGGARVPASLPFTLTLLGRKHQVNARISKWRLQDKIATFDLDFDLSLKECGIDVPSVLFLIRVGDTIHLHAPVKLLRNPS